jgi:hypothetical protein
MYTLEIRQGRFLEARISSPIAIAEVASFGLRLREILSGTKGSVVICTDLRRANVFPPEVADAFVGLMKGDNPRVERSAFLAGESAMFGLQIERMLRDAGNPARKSFRDRAALAAWLGELLDEKERVRLAAYLEEPVLG